MALTKIKLNEVETKADPVLADGVLLSDSADGGRGKISTLTDLQTLIGGGGGAVDSVAGKTGVVTLDADDVSPTSTKLWMSDTQQSMIEGLSDALALKAPLASPALTGTPTAPTASVGTNTTQLATTEFCGNYNQKWTYSYSGAEGTRNATPWTMHAFGANGTLTLPLASSVASGVQVAAIVVTGGAEVVLTRSGSDRIVTPTGLANTYTLQGNGSSIVLVRVTETAWACVGAPDSLINAAIAPLAPLASPALTGTPTAPTAAAGTNTTQIATTEFVQAATASAIYDLPVTRSGLASPGTDVVLFETGVLDPAWYDETHVLNVSFFARNESGVSSNTAFKFQLYDEATSTAHTIASINEDTMDYLLLQASIYRADSSRVNCNIQYGYFYGSGSVSLAAGSYKLRVVCTSTLSTIFGAAQVRFTK